MAQRHLARSIALQTIFEWDFSKLKKEQLESVTQKNIQEFGPGLDDKEFVRRLVHGVIDHQKEIDVIIVSAAPEWPIEQISPVDRNVLRLGLYELLFGDRKEVPPKVAINEAIELAKTFGGESSGRFVNGVLGTVYREIGEPGREHKKGEKALPEEELAGAVVFRREGNEVYLAMIQDAFSHWTFVKGHIEEGESLEQAALREANEEIGVQGKMIAPLGKKFYTAKDGQRHIRRNVTSYLIETTDRELRLESSGGLKDAKWVPLTKVKGMKHYPDQNELIEKSIQTIKSLTV